MLPINGVKTVRASDSKVYITTSNNLYELQEDTKNFLPIIKDKIFSYFSAYYSGYICFIAKDSPGQGTDFLYCLATQTGVLTKLGKAYIGLYLKIFDGKVYWPDTERRLNTFSLSSKNHIVYNLNNEISNIYGVVSDKIIASYADSAIILDPNTMQITWKKDFRES